MAPEAPAPRVWDEVPISRPIDLRRLAQQSGVALAALQHRNPGLLHDITPPNTHHALRVPPGLGPSLARKVAAMPTAQRLTYWQHRVRSGETLSGIALAYHADMRAVAEMNPVEIAHRHHRPLGDRGRGRGIADNGKAGRHLRDSFKSWRGRDRDLAAVRKSSGPRPASHAWFISSAAAG